MRNMDGRLAAAGQVRSSEGNPLRLPTISVSAIVISCVLINGVAVIFLPSHPSFQMKK
ncbi:hypothetical protein [Puia dinghuensis]|uniref:hypothetical protein n=1 Tax=Puia dinghuensis TaxID=1792502 RepID=UPI001663EA75|nr:hypothetical protein [Puia dinghuensis]